MAENKAMTKELEEIKAKVAASKVTSPVSYTHLDVYKRQALIQDPPDEFSVDLFHTAGRGGIPHRAPVGPPPPDDPPEAKKAVECKDDDLVCLFQPPGITCLLYTSSGYR